MQIVLGTADSYPESLVDTVSDIEKSLPGEAAMPPINDIINSQAQVSTHMANHLESLASHYGQMAGAMQESEAGEAFSEDDLQSERHPCCTIRMSTP